jgi:hypothetical protein
VDGNLFDSYLRSLASSRRTLVGGSLVSLLGLTTLEIAEARRKRKRKKKCKGGKVKCGKACCASGDVCQVAATGTCCPQARACGPVCCGATQVCANPETATCVVGTGTCNPASGSCGTGGNFTFCNNNPLCVCALATNGIVRCGTPIPTITPVDCGLCSTDADCAIRFPGVVGAFCAANASAPCSCAAGQNLCVAPCPTA